MSPYDEMTRAISVRFSDKIKKSCSCLFDCFNIHQFYYCTITNDGYFANLDTNIALSEYISAEKLYLSYPYFAHPKYIEDGVGLIRDAQNSALRNIINVIKYKFNYQLWVRFVKKIPNGIEEFGFHSYSDNEIQASVFINEQPLFRLFFNKFREDNPAVFRQIEESKINIAELIGPAFYKKRIDLVSDRVSREAFLKAMGIDVGEPLTQREVGVIKLLLDGYSAGKIASHIFLSKRTVEHHIERIKAKLACASKPELIQKARELEQLGYFSS